MPESGIEKIATRIEFDSVRVSNAVYELKAVAMETNIILKSQLEIIKAIHWWMAWIGLASIASLVSVGLTFFK